MRSLYSNLDMKKSSVIYNGIDFQDIGKAEETSRCLPNNQMDHTLLFYGRLSWLKGTSYLLEAFTRLLKEYPSTQLKIFGKGPMEEQISKSVVKNGLKGRVQLCGHIPRNKLLLEIIKSDIVVLPSLREAQPLSVLEAMACKKPVVVFDFPFVKEYVRDATTGLLANPLESQNLADKIEILLSDSKLRRRIGENSYNYTKKHHNWESLIDKYINIYRKIAA
jgi:glycosyltransferase involved in cell wall biosynthesis